MSSVLLTVSAVIRTPCRTGRPPPAPVPPLLPSNDPRPEAFVAAVCVGPKPDEPFGLVPVDERDPKPFDVELLLLPLIDRRSVLDVAEVPDPGAIWLLAASSEAEDDPPMNISGRPRAIWRASPYFTR